VCQAGLIDRYQQLYQQLETLKEISVNTRLLVAGHDVASGAFGWQPHRAHRLGATLAADVHAIPAQSQPARRVQATALGQGTQAGDLAHRALDRLCAGKIVGIANSHCIVIEVQLKRVCNHLTHALR
jgi:hypothetical protein